MVVAINQTNSFNVTLTEHSITVTKIINSKAYSLTAPIFSLNGEHGNVLGQDKWLKAIEQLNRMLAMSDEDFKLFAKMQQDLNKEIKEDDNV